MKLDAYLKSQKITMEAFAVAVGVTKATISRYCRGTRKPDAALCVRINSVTRGKVTANDFYLQPPEERGSSKGEGART